MVMFDFTHNGAFSMAKLIQSEGKGIVSQSFDIHSAVELAGSLVKRGLKSKVINSTINVDPRYALAISELSKLVCKDEEFIARTLKYNDWYKNMIKYLQDVYSCNE